MSISGEMVTSFAPRDSSSCLFHSLTSSFFCFCFCFVFLGVYLTSKGPSNGRKKTLLNNFDDAGQVVTSKRLWAKLEYVVQIKIDKNKVEKVSGDSNREVFLFKGDIHLENFQHCIYKNPSTKDED